MFYESSHNDILKMLIDLKCTQDDFVILRKNRLHNHMILYEQFYFTTHWITFSQMANQGMMKKIG